MLFLRTFVSKPSKETLFSALFAERSVNVERDVAYCDHPRHRLDIYHPLTAAPAAPVVVFFYGGGWDSGAREFYGFVGAALAARGIVAVIPDYRLYPEIRYPGYMSDAASAYHWVRENLTTGDAPVFISGHSAGAHIGALLCYDRSYLKAIGSTVPAPRGFIGFSGPYGYDPTTHPRSRHIFTDAENAAKVQPVNQVRENAPPALLMHGAKDTIVKTLNAFSMRDRLNEAGSHARAIEFENIGHTGLILALSKPFRYRAPVLKMTTEFVRDQAK